MAREKICGIYTITNLINNKVYIGQSIDIIKRFYSHKSSLNRDCHQNIFLQRSWNKFGENNFKFEIIEKCNDNDLDIREVYYINLLSSNNDKYGYNLTSGGCKFKVNEQILINKSLKYSKQILQFTKEGLFISEYLNARQAALKYNINASLITRCCRGERESAYHCIWKYKDDCMFSYQNNKVVNIDDYDKLIVYNPICQLDLNGNLVREWNTCSDVGKFYNIVYENIRSCCDKKYGRKTYIGFIWMYADEYYKNGVNLEDYKLAKSNKPINQYDLNNNFIATYESAREAEKLTGIGYKMISRVCNGGRPHTHGYIFKFV